MKRNLDRMLSSYYEAVGDPTSRLGKFCIEYHRRHCIESACILTQYDDEQADATVEYLRPRIEGKIVVEVGAGIGLLACHLGHVAKRVYAIEADPAWSQCFLIAMYENKPKNVTFIFGAADEVPPLSADVALFCTHSGQEAMYRAASRFAPEVIDVYEEIMPGRSRAMRDEIINQFGEQRPPVERGEQ